ncbi:MAG: response regulator [Deltaproteobacteria bacterium]|nr:response regulator [Deltaproteobacteria bacterium]MBW2041583.1 response regulator [Deltaproteobacteria bacterium]
MQKILVIDDEEANVRVLTLSLKLDGYEVAGALSGEEGLEKYETFSPQIVLTDIKMPGMDGLTVLKKIKAMNPDTEVIIITGHGDIDSAIEALQYGASDFINKPVKDEALSVALRRANEKLAIREQLRAYTHDLENMVMIATEEVKRKSNFQEQLITSSNDGIVATDDEFKVVIFNPSAERIMGYGRLEVVREMDIRDLLSPEILKLLEPDTGGGKMKEDLPWTETVLRSKTGEAIPVRFSWRILMEKGQVMGSVAFFHDLREIKRLERELVHSERLAAIGQTVAGMAHCIKNILHGFKGGSYLVDLGLDKNDNEKLKSGWTMIQRAIGRTSDLVMDLLTYSKERDPEYVKCAPNEIAEEVCEFIKDFAAENGITLVKDFDGSIGEVVMDQRILHRCLLNLMTNAVDACLFDENTEKSFQVRLGTRLGRGNRIRFEVEDNGCGMDDDVRRQLFTSFFSTKGPKGTGLGLLVTHKLVKEHGGDISFSTQPGKGTIFTLSIPFKDTLEDAADE